MSYAIYDNGRLHCLGVLCDRLQLVPHTFFLFNVPMRLWNEWVEKYGTNS